MFLKLEEKLNYLLDIIDDSLKGNFSQVVIYCDNSDSVISLKKDLESKSHIVSFYYPNHPFGDGNLTINEFISGTTKILITTDISTKILERLKYLVINYNLPHFADNYIKRVGKYDKTESKNN